MKSSNEISEEVFSTQDSLIFLITNRDRPDVTDVTKRFLKEFYGEARSKCLHSCNAETFSWMLALAKIRFNELLEVCPRLKNYETIHVDINDTGAVIYASDEITLGHYFLMGFRGDVSIFIKAQKDDRLVINPQIKIIY